MWNLPNVLTAFRILLVPLFVIFFYIDSSVARWITLGIFCFAAATDWLDGFLARRMNIESPFGAFLDPVADKLMVAITLILLVEREGSLLLAIPAMVIIGREITISALREWMAEVGNRAVVGVSVIGKLKTLSQMFAIFLFLLAPPSVFGLPKTFGFVFIWLSALLTLWSMFSYLKAAWPYLTSSENDA
ncbi:CDP-diacylglycerol--glycerol-3-phosphate 3-phosphatidyltransferase [Kangiella koreensis]|jgi:CDP-diacylglycerol--glycerol-3-phosphate 3-phosphatidyltransferase|uniref:CDP-diacylglycerol--glycerol-3-phosphate 3-phosphatidyltransferase n=1 Tax=Kangiella koreensis (strain DSM 16069 / JCM 12317 / KCTC 12182 / SW-125) TaxID=523791 RepID=C7RAS5_KANKD|nr:CDP-diacylglycerol--glycerol-3-phosphate 3-phosphatidyltransferase [Kangiella koreensis]ACV26367.1 CDP-diacylglycerol/glycerol-3-phosphate3-phosphatidyltransferase [Kangiella koreensis DSM 16069]MCW9029218.1 CDP-diacylglycerol--glycerol-3-phosphate 3-phosphatidyltransferase [Kangiella sp.]